jgi:hypothetical protein
MPVRKGFEEYASRLDRPNLSGKVGTRAIAQLSTHGAGDPNGLAPRARRILSSVACHEGRAFPRAFWCARQLLVLVPVSG